MNKRAALLNSPRRLALAGFTSFMPAAQQDIGGARGGINSRSGGEWPRIRWLAGQGSIGAYHHPIRPGSVPLANGRSKARFSPTGAVRHSTGGAVHATLSERRYVTLGRSAGRIYVFASDAGRSFI